MHLLVVISIIFVGFSQILAANIIEKCCENGYEVFGSKCVEKNTKRVFVSGFYNSSKLDGLCIDSTGEDFYIFDSKNNKFTNKTQIYSNFTKCCPVGYIYNTKIRSCTPSKEAKEDFFTNSLIQVGLKKCVVIFDKKFENLEDLKDVMVEKSTEDGEYCVDQSVGDGYVMRECQDDLEVCLTKRCLKKCCPEGQSYVGGGTCKDTYVFGMVTENQSYSPYIDDIKDDYEVIYGTGCPKIRLNFNNTIQYRIDQNGTFIYYHNYSESFVQEPVFNFYSYCLEHAEKGSIYGYYLFTCYNFKEIDVKFTHTLWAKIMSCIFLVFTIVIYFLVGETKNTFGKILINYCVNVILLMVTLMVSQIDVLPSRLECKLRGYFIIIFTLASFAWFNIMSLNIWWTFSTPKRMIGSDQKRKELKKFLLYFLYGWGMPISLALLILLLENTNFLPKVIQPYVGIFFCSLENRNYAPIVFFLLPQLIFQAVNTTLFVKTIIYCIKVKNDINRLNDLSKDNGNGKFSVAKERLGLIIKLGIVMGVIWIFEVATAFFTKMHSYNAFTKYLEVVLDNLICLQGTFIFLIFICKRKTFNKLKKRLSFNGQSASQSSCTTQSTSFCPMNKKQNTRTNLDEA